MDEIVLVSNGPGELYTWAQPVLRELRLRAPELKLSISLIPCQFASGREAAIAETFGADTVTTPADFVKTVALGKAPSGLGAASGAVVSLGGSADMALRLADTLGYPCYRYGFEPTWRRGFTKLFVPDDATAKRARRLGAPGQRLEIVGNLVADAVQAAEPLKDPGRPHLLLFASSRNAFAIHLIPFIIGLVDHLAERYQEARFIWPISRLLTEDTLARGIAAETLEALGGSAGHRDGEVVLTPKGHRLEMVAEEARYLHMQSADLAITVPGTNTLELGIAGVPTIVMLPMNKPEAIPLEGAGHWLSLIPFIGTSLKRQAVKLFVEGLKQPVSLPNRLSGQDLMVEMTGRLSVEKVAAQAEAMLAQPDRLEQIRTDLKQQMPKPGAARRLVASVLADAD